MKMRNYMDRRVISPTSPTSVKTGPQIQLQIVTFSCICSDVPEVIKLPHFCPNFSPSKKGRLLSALFKTSCLKLEKKARQFFASRPRWEKKKKLKFRFTWLVCIYFRSLTPVTLHVIVSNPLINEHNPIAISHVSYLWRNVVVTTMQIPVHKRD